MSNIDAAALAQARERLENDYEDGVNYRVITRTVEVNQADLRLVLDALREARRQAFEEIAAIAERESHPEAIEHAARALAAKEQA